MGVCVCVSPIMCLFPNTHTHTHTHTGVSVLPPTMGGLKKSKEEQELDDYMAKLEKRHAEKGIGRSKPGTIRPDTTDETATPAAGAGGEDTDMLDDFLNSV